MNTAINDGTDIAELMSCFMKTKVNNPKFPKLSKRVTQFKESVEGVREMCAIVESYAEKKAEEYAKRYAEKYANKREAERIIKTVNNLMEQYDFTLENACQAAGITQDEYEKVRSLTLDVIV